MKKAIQTSKAPAAIGPYSQAIAAGNFLYISGQLPIDPANGEMPDGIEARAKQSLENLQAILAEAGLSMANVVKTTVFLTDMGDFAAVNSVYATFFQETPPARSAVQVAALPKGATIEIEAIAYK